MTAAPIATRAKKHQPGTPTDSQLSSPRLRLWVPITAHAVTDFFSFVTIALMPLLAVRLGMNVTQKATLLALGAAASGGVQPLVAWINDRFDTRLTGTLGLALAAASIGMLGFVHTYPALLVLFVFGVLGVGAFHPSAAAAVGQLAGKRRSAMLSVFFLFGMIGGVSGNVLTPMYVNLAGSLSGAASTGGPEAAVNAGMKALAWLIIPGLATAAVLGWAIHNAPHRHGSASEHHTALSRAERRRRWHAVWLLYACNVIRFTVNQMLVYLTVEWVERLVRRHNEVAALDLTLGQSASEINGPMQGAMQVGMGAGALALGFLLPARLEKTAFVTIPIVGALALALIPHTDAWLGSGYWAVLVPAAALTVLSGVGFGSLIPVSMSIGQRLLPHRTSLASGLMLGGAWSIAFVGAYIAKAIHGGVDTNLETGFLAAGGILLIASTLAAFLPGRLLREVATH